MIKIYSGYRYSRCFPCLLAVLIVVLSFATPARSTSFTLGQNFTGSTYLVDSFLIVPDSMGAVGPNHFVELINGRYSVYRKSDGRRVQTSNLDQFWRNSGVVSVSSAFDPRIVYDHTSERWFGAAVDFRRSASSNFLVAVSQSSDPTTGWTGFSIDSDSANTRWADFPSLGVDRDGVYLAANMFDIPGDAIFASFDVTILTIPKFDLLSSIPSIRNASRFEAVGNTDVRGSSLQPTVDVIVPDGGGTFLSVDSDVIRRTDVRNVVGPGRMVLTSPSTISIPAGFSPPDAVQPNGVGRISTNGNRLSSSPFEVGDRLWAVNSIEMNGRAAIRWYEIDEDTNILLQEGLISDPSHDYFYPSIAANQFGDVVIGFSRSGEDEFVSAYAVVGDTRDGMTAFGDPVLLQAGIANYFITDPIGRNRWGDYSATSLDPTDPFRFWTIQEWASGPNIWSTQISEVIVGSAMNAIPEPSTFLLFGSGLIGLCVWRWKYPKTSNTSHHNS